MPQRPRRLRPSSDDRKQRAFHRLAPHHVAAATLRPASNHDTHDRFPAIALRRLDVDRLAVTESRVHADRRLRALRPSPCPASGTRSGSGSIASVDVALSIGVIDSQNELATRLTCQQPVKKGGSNASDVKITGGTGRKSSTDHDQPEVEGGEKVASVLLKILDPVESFTADTKRRGLSCNAASSKQLTDIRRGTGIQLVWLKMSRWR